MTQQDQTKKRSNSSGGGALRGRGRFSGKKPAPVPKVPKRGPGIAFLEKERIQNEERRLLAAAISPTPPPPPPPPSPPSPRMSYLPLQLPGFHHSNQLSSSSPGPLQSSSDGVSMNFPYESNPPSGWTPRKQQYQQPSSSMVNVPSENLAVPVDYYSREPPSNQNNSSSFVVPKMVVPMDKMIILERSRSYPPSKAAVGVPPAASSFNFKSNESTNYLNFGEAPSAFRQVPSRSTTLSEPNSKKNKNLNGDFVSLAPPISPSESESTSTFPAAFHNQERFQGTEEDQIPHGQQPRLHNSFPTKEQEEAQSVQTTETNKDGNCNGENGESLDLDLHL